MTTYQCFRARVYVQLMWLFIKMCVSEDMWHSVIKALVDVWCCCCHWCLDWNWLDAFRTPAQLPLGWRSGIISDAWASVTATNKLTSHNTLPPFERPGFYDLQTREMAAKWAVQGLPMVKTTKESPNMENRRKTVAPIYRTGTRVYVA